MKFENATLGELSVNGTGSYGIAASAVPYNKNLFTYLRITDINDDGTLNKSGLMSVDDDKAARYLLKPNDIVFARTGGSTGRNYFYDGTEGEFVFAGFLIKFSIDETKVNPRFVKYYCLSRDYKNWVNSFNTGSTRGNINAQTYANMPIPLPPRAQQDLLVETLSALDDKIELNNKINENLEQQAQAIFKSWFVDFEPFGGKMPDDWKVGKLSEIAEITMGQSPDGKSYNEEGIGTVFYQGRTDFGFRFPTRRLCTTKPNRMAKCGDALMSVRAPVGDLNVAYEECCIGRGLAAIRSKDNHQSFVLYTLFTLKNQLDVFNGEGTVFGSVNKDALNFMKIVIPPADLIDKFESIANPIDRTICNNYRKICKLQDIRDTLLPKLMNGEIDVSKVKI
ncbi:MAG: restriction endonuclease subunit S [Treponemataceae bacterium]|nr:restriction endonuclease subunit S [Treponemataceae bacterium]